MSKDTNTYGEHSPILSLAQTSDLLGVDPSQVLTLVENYELEPVSMISMSFLRRDVIKYEENNIYNKTLTDTLNVIETLKS